MIHEKVTADRGYDEDEEVLAGKKTFGLMRDITLKRRRICHQAIASHQRGPLAWFTNTC